MPKIMPGLGAQALTMPQQLTEKPPYQGAVTCKDLKLWTGLKPSLFSKCKKHVPADFNEYTVDCGVPSFEADSY